MDPSKITREVGEGCRHARGCSSAATLPGRGSRYCRASRSDLTAIGGVKTFGKAVANRGEPLSRRRNGPERAKPGKAEGDPQLPKRGALLSGRLARWVEAVFGCGSGPIPGSTSPFMQSSSGTYHCSPSSRPPAASIGSHRWLFSVRSRRSSKLEAAGQDKIISNGDGLNFVLGIIPVAGDRDTRTSDSGDVRLPQIIDLARCEIKCAAASC